MNNTEYFLAGFVLLLFFIFFTSLKLNKINPNKKKHLIGGCSGTRWGCCLNSKKACKDRKCSNCK